MKNPIEFGVKGEIAVLLILIALGATIVDCLKRGEWIAAGGFFLLAAIILFSVRDRL